MTFGRHPARARRAPATRTPAPDAVAETRRERGDGETRPETPDVGVAPGSARGLAHRRRGSLLAAGLVVLLAVPLVVALVALRHPRWYPLLDLAQTEIRVRGVGTGQPPLIGLAGRFGTLAHQGSHPGPLSFWAMWPFYRVFRGTSWGLQAAAVSLHLSAMGAALWIALRRGGPRLVLGTAVVVAVLAHGYGAATLTEAWNPYLPVLWWLVFLLAVWSVACDDLPLLPVAVFAGSFCGQTEVAYLGMSAVLLGVAAAVASARVYRRRRVPGVTRRFVRWGAVALAVGVAVWLPPIIDQITSRRGNFSVLWQTFRHPPEGSVGLRRGVEVLLIHLNPWRLVADQVVTARAKATTGSVVPGLLLLAVWAAAAVAAARMRHRSSLRLHLVVAGAVVLGVVSISRIFGTVWYYLVLWGWGINGVMLLAIGWTVVLLAGGRLSRGSRARAATAGSLALAGIAVLSTVLFAIGAARVEVPDGRLSRTLGDVVRPTVRALDRGAAPGGGRKGRYLVTWGDPLAIGAQGFGLLNELDREGFDVGTLELYRGGATPRLVLDPARATGVVHLSIGIDIATWRAKPGVRQVAYADPRGTRERAEYERLRSRVIDELRADGLSELVPGVDTGLLSTIFDRRVPQATRDQMVRMFDLGLPTAVFVGPPGIER